MKNSEMLGAFGSSAGSGYGNSVAVKTVVTHNVNISKKSRRRKSDIEG